MSKPLGQVVQVDHLLRHFLRQLINRVGQSLLKGVGVGTVVFRFGAYSSFRVILLNAVGRCSCFDNEMPDDKIVCNLRKYERLNDRNNSKMAAVTLSNQNIRHDQLRDIGLRLCRWISLHRDSL